MACGFGWRIAVGVPALAIGAASGALAVGEDNSTPYSGGPQAGNEFPLVCQTVMDAEATWMWFDWDLNDSASPFLWPGGTNPDHQFLLFRLPAQSLASLQLRVSFSRFCPIKSKCDPSFIQLSKLWSL